MTAPAAGSNGRGRRIYIHENALSHLARQDPAVANLVFETLAQIAVRKTLFHQVEQDGVALGAISAESARRLGGEIDGEGAEAASRCLRALAYKPEGGAPEPLPLLGPAEKVTDTCYFDQHYAFATSEQMGKLMHQDERSMAEVRRLKESGEDYRDLLLVSGPSLVFERPDPRSHRPLTPEQAAQVRMATLGRVRHQLHKLLDGLELTEKERFFVIERVERALATAFAHGALKTV